MQQKSFSEQEYGPRLKPTRQDRFLAEIAWITPWSESARVLNPCCPKGERGHPPIEFERMLRMGVARQCFGRSDEAIEDAPHDSRAIRALFASDLGRQAARDATTLLKFQRPFAKHQLTEAIFQTVKPQPEARGLLLRQGTIFDASIIPPPRRPRTRPPPAIRASNGQSWAISGNQA